MYLTETSGKGIRKKMIQAFNTWLNVPQDKVVVISRVVSMLHSASLMFAVLLGLRTFNLMLYAGWTMWKMTRSFGEASRVR